VVVELECKLPPIIQFEPGVQGERIYLTGNIPYGNIGYSGVAKVKKKVKPGT